MIVDVGYRDPWEDAEPRDRDVPTAEELYLDDLEFQLFTRERREVYEVEPDGVDAPVERLSATETTCLRACQRVLRDVRLAARERRGPSWLRNLSAVGPTGSASGGVSGTTGRLTVDSVAPRTWRRLRGPTGTVARRATGTFAA